MIYKDIRWSKIKRVVTGQRKVRASRQPGVTPVFVEVGEMRRNSKGDWKGAASEVGEKQGKRGVLETSFKEKHVDNNAQCSC